MARPIITPEDTASPVRFCRLPSSKNLVATIFLLPGGSVGDVWQNERTGEIIRLERSLDDDVFKVTRRVGSAPAAYMLQGDGMVRVARGPLA